MIIGLGHRSDNGKDTVANYMIDWIRAMRPELKVDNITWADKLKDICYQLYKHLGLQTREFYDTPEGRALRNVKLPKIDLTPVEIWVKMGTPAVREQVWDDTWISYLLSRQSEYDVIFVPDTRFPNEVEACDYTIKVHNPRKPIREGVSVDCVLKDFDGWDITIINEHGLSELRGQANILADKLFGTKSVERLL